jgi:hypothetical protein
MRYLTPLIVAAVLPIAAFAGTATISSSGKDKAVQPVECVPDTLDSVIATTDYGFHQDLKRGSGNLEVEHNDFEIDRRIPLNLLTWPNVQCGQWFVRLGADYERFDMSIHNETRLPDTLQSVSGVIALEYLVNNQTAFMIETRPGVYFEHKINGGSFDAPTNVAMAYPIFGGDKFYLVAGVTVSGLARYPVFPIGGVVWHINDQWDLRAYLPNPRLVYVCCQNVELWVGGELVGGAYKTDNRNVNPVKLSGGVLTYDEVRAGAGFTWKATPLTFDFGAGYTVQSEFDYTRAGESFNTHPAPYVRLTARLDF